MNQYKKAKPGSFGIVNILYKGIYSPVYRYFQQSGPLGMVILATLIGIVGGLASIAFKLLILGVKHIFYGATTTDGFLDAVLSLPWQYRLFAPAIGGLIIGPVIAYFVKEARGHGVPEVMESVAKKDGIMRFRIVPLKVLVSAICIGSGGSAGREGPIVQIGSAFGSSVGKFLKLSTEKTKALLGAGAAAGIAGTFNAPLAGVIFSIEVILRNIRLRFLSAIVIASVVGVAVVNIFLDRFYAVFSIPPHEMISFWEVFFYIGLGVSAAVISLTYQKMIYGMEHFFEKISLPMAVKPAMGGLLLGGLALWLPQIHATGYPVMEQALYGSLTLQFALVLMLAKIIATSLTLGSGGSGGIFAPGLFIGAMMGAGYGSLINIIFPELAAGPGSYAMVGMGAVFAGATHAPLTSIIILYEMTHDHGIILPMMFACIISSTLTRWYQKKNIYTTKLINRGIDIDQEEEHKLLENIQVREAMTSDIIKIPSQTIIKDTFKYFEKSFYSYLPVADSTNGELVGILRYDSIIDLKEEDLSRNAQDLCVPPAATVYEDDSLLKAFNLISKVSVKMIPVLADDRSKRLVGVLARGDILDRYYKYTSEHEEEVDIHIISREVASVNKLIESALQPIRGQTAEKEIVIQRELDEDLPEVKIDFTKMTWVITHILGNAVRCGSPGDKITVSAKSKKKKVQISISDTGPGMSKKYVENIFQHKAIMEKCLGLTIAKDIVEGHKGEISGKTRSGKGTSFTITIPVHGKDREE